MNGGKEVFKIESHDNLLVGMGLAKGEAGSSPGKSMGRFMGRSPGKDILVDFPLHLAEAGFGGFNQSRMFACPGYPLVNIVPQGGIRRPPFAVSGTRIPSQLFMADPQPLG
jgi:hypothetical protein